jgi:hypothetical protein
MKLLAFLSRRLDFLKRFPLLPLLLDAMLTVWTMMTRPAVHRRVLSLCSEIKLWSSVSERLHRYGGVQFDFEGRELGHVHSNGVVDLRFRRSIRDELVSSGRALPHHTFPCSGWVTLNLHSEAELLNAIALFRLSQAEASTRPVPQGGAPDRSENASSSLCSICISSAGSLKAR